LGESGEITEFRAALYVRTATEQQQYSTDTQSDKIRDYANKRGIEIVKTYTDEGKSGLSIFGRTGLQKLLSDVDSGRADFSLILVYDISRWGRFLDPGEGAYCEYICKRAGIHGLDMMADPRPILNTARFLSQDKGKPPMTQLSDTQALILSAAAQRPDHIALPLPDSLRGGAAAKVVSTMIAKGLIEEVDAYMRKSEPVWRETGDGHGVTLIATNAGLAAIGIELEDAAAEPIDKAAPKTRTPRDGTKQATLISMLSAPDGATIDEIVKETQWLGHTIRGAMSGALKKKLGLTITSEKVESRGRVYAIRD
jgi:hypothetical protein